MQVQIDQSNRLALVPIGLILLDTPEPVFLWVAMDNTSLRQLKAANSNEVYGRCTGAHTRCTARPLNRHQHRQT